MTKSMTAFARVQSSNESGILTREVRSVNSRYLDVNMRLPEDFRACEVRYRELISKKLNRGKVECNLRFMPELAVENGIEMNKTIAKTVVDACQEINNFFTWELCYQSDRGIGLARRSQGIRVRFKTAAYC